MIKGQRPSRHSRVVSTNKGKKRVTINKNVKKKTPKTKVSSHKRNGTKVSGYKRTKRAKGKKITYKTTGIFQLAHDELGNIRGSRIKPLPKKTERKTKKRIVLSKDNINKIDTRFYTGDLTTKEWLELRRKKFQ